MMTSRTAASSQTTETGESHQVIMSSTASMSTKAGYSFLSLPPEIRNIIYNFALVDAHNTMNRTNYPLYMRSGRYSVRKLSDLPKVKIGRPESAPYISNMSPNLLATNEQIHSEAKGVLYGQTLHFESGGGLDDFLDVIGPTNLALIRDVCVYDTSCMSTLSPWTMSRLLRRVRRLRFELRSGHCTNQSFRWLYRELDYKLAYVVPKNIEGLQERFMEREVVVLNYGRQIRLSKTWTRSEDDGQIIDV